MQKTKIEWCDYTINPVKGLCPMACSYCYARRMYKRFKWNSEIRYIGRTKLFDEVLRISRDKPARVFIGSTIELFGDWVETYWMNDILEVVNTFSFFTFIFLTKQPQNLIRWSPFPANVWLGVSATNQQHFYNAVKYLKEVEATVKFLSLEPLLERINVDYDCFDWLIIGSRTQPTQHPQKSWVLEILEASDKANISVFVKEPMASHYGIFRQEYPLGAMKQRMIKEGHGARNRAR